MAGILTWLVAAVSCVSAAGLSFDSEKITLRAEHGATQLVFSFRFENQSGEPVAVEKIEQDCGCLKGKPLFEIVEPGASGEIQGLMELKGLHGTVAKSMWLRFTNGERHELVAEVVIPETLVIRPVDLVWKKGGDAGEQQVDIRVESGPSMEITGVSSNLPHFEVRSETVEVGRHYIILCTCVPNPPTRTWRRSFKSEHPARTRAIPSAPSSHPSPTGGIHHLEIPSHPHGGLDPCPGGM